MEKPFYMFVDVDETFVRNYSTTRIPMRAVIAHIQEMKKQGALMYCWSSGGAEYARESAKEFGLEKFFAGFLAKPDVVRDCQGMWGWRNAFHVFPNECERYDIHPYREAARR